MRGKDMEIKAIETKYNGFHFRSRLEARWAVFFDEMGYRYEYEREGFNLGHTYYLPDFYLNDLDIFFEVKGADPTEVELKKCEDLGFEKAIAISSGGFSSNEVKPVTLFGMEMGDSSGGFGTYEIFFLNDPEKDAPAVGTFLSDSHTLYSSSDGGGIFIPTITLPLPLDSKYFLRHKNAVLAAKMKRF